MCLFSEAFQYDSWRVGAKSDVNGVAEVCHRGFYSLACNLELPNDELISRSFSALLPRGCEERKTGTHCTEIEITIIDLRLRRTLLYPLRNDSYEQ
jgi:hypothetical protein